MNFGRHLLLPLFLLRLCLVISPTLIKFSLIPLKKHWHLVLSLFFLIVIVILNLLISPTRLSETNHTSSQAEGLINQQIQYWESLRQLQPTHRDVLVNLAVLHQAQGNQDQAQEYLDQAKKIDPNHPLFSN